jgi:hypothetical protein
MARRKYEAQKVGSETGHIEPWYSPDGVIDEPWELTLFSARRGDWTVSVDSMNPDPEFQMYWTRIPDFGIKEYEVYPHEQGWVAKQVFRGTAIDGTPVVGHQIDFVTTDDQCRIVRIEWYVDSAEWERIWSVASGKPIEEVHALVTTLGGFQRLIDGTSDGRDRGRTDQELSASAEGARPDGVRGQSQRV